MAILTGDGATIDRAGRIEIATDAEALSGADVDRAITPDQLMAVVSQGVSAVTGGLVYKGVFDATAQAPDLSNAEQGHFYKVEVAGTAFNKTFAVGDMLLINADMNGVIDPTKVDKIDNGESLAQLDDLTDVTLVNSTTGEVLRYDGNGWVNDKAGTDDVESKHTGVNYTGALNGSLTSHLSGIDSELNNRADTVNSIAVVNGAVTIGSDDIAGNHTGVNYTGLNTDSITTHLAGIDSELNNRADTVNSVAVINGAVTIGSDDITGNHTGVNYTGLNTDSITTHLDGIDEAIGNLDGTVASLELDNLTDVTLGTLTAGEVLRYDGVNWVDATLSYNDLSNTPALADSTDDLTSDHAGVNYTGALNGSLTSHLSGIDSELNNRADTVNSVAVINGTVTIGSDDITGNHTAVNYTGLNTDSITTHLAGIDNVIGGLDGTVASLELDNLNDVTLSGTLTAGEVLRYDGANWVDATLSYNDLSNTPALADSTDDLTSDHAGVNYTGALNGSLTSHLSGIDTALGSLTTDLGGLTDVTLGTLTAGEVLRYDGVNWVDATLSYNDLSNTPAIADSTDDLTSDHTGVNYTGALNGSLTSHLSGIDTALGSLTTDLGGLTDVTLGTLTAGEVLRYDGANWVDATLSYNDLSNTPALADSTDDLTSDHTGVNYTGALNGSLTSHLSGIDSELNNRADTINSIAVVNGAVTIGSDDITGNHTAVNYTGLNTDSITTHLAGIDSALAVAVSNAGLDDLQDVVLGTLTSGEVLRYDGANWVDATLSYNDLSNTPALADSTDDLTSDHTGVNYTGALNGSLTSHLSGIDSELNNRADTVNSIAVVNGAVTIDSDDITGNHTGVNYTGLNTDSITTHLAGIDNVIGGLDLTSLDGIALSGTLTAGEVLRYDGNDWVDATLSYNDLSNTPALADSTDDLTSDHTGVNYTGALNGSLTSHLSGIDTKIGTLAGAGQVEDVTTATTLSKGFLYQAVNAGAITHTLPATSSSNEGDTVKVMRGSTGTVTVQQDPADSGLKIRSASGFSSTYKLNKQGEYVEFIFDADDTLWRMVDQRKAYVENVITTTSNPLAITEPYAVYDLQATGTGTIAVTLPISADLKTGDTFKFRVAVDRDIELNVAGADSGNVAFFQGSTNHGDQVTVSALNDQVFEVHVLASGDYLVSNVLGTASRYDVGTLATNVVQLDAQGKLPAVDGSLLTGISAGGGLSFSRQGADFNANVNFHYSVSTSTGAVIANLPALSSVNDGDQVRFYFRERTGTDNLTVTRASATSDTINGATSWLLDVQYESITLVANTTDSIWEIV
jgi:ribosome assembly protein YihI (activator of Der GTPase)